MPVESFHVIFPSKAEKFNHCGTARRSHERARARATPVCVSSRFSLLNQFWHRQVATIRTDRARKCLTDLTQATQFPWILFFL
jgi:hypothetical protein